MYPAVLKECAAICHFETIWKTSPKFLPIFLEIFSTRPNNIKPTKLVRVFWGFSKFEHLVKHQLWIYVRRTNQIFHLNQTKKISNFYRCISTKAKVNQGHSIVFNLQIFFLNSNSGFFEKLKNRTSTLREHTNHKLKYPSYLHSPSQDSLPYSPDPYYFPLVYTWPSSPSARRTLDAQCTNDTCAARDSARWRRIRH